MCQYFELPYLAGGGGYLPHCGIFGFSKQNCVRGGGEIGISIQVYDT